MLIYCLPGVVSILLPQWLIDVLLHHLYCHVLLKLNIFIVILLSSYNFSPFLPLSVYLPTLFMLSAISSQALLPMLYLPLFCLSIYHYAIMCYIKLSTKALQSRYLYSVQRIILISASHHMQIPSAVLVTFISPPSLRHHTASYCSFSSCLSWYCVMHRPL